ncbi:hypothetical protein A33K_18557 [Burkholderia humptydooensis MSMB43]|uniref:Solute-binding protein family 3/N-terminal domain-containing protein n=1 Tax=Burkholderia humptydooensis MSMB43 TaxID=441157 RepID=A0ABN0FXM6_9BURK|nr:hypothetical protein A33K_18557 [Burkholderia humptydooensis MSMB43]
MMAADARRGRAIADYAAARRIARKNRIDRQSHMTAHDTRRTTPSPSARDGARRSLLKAAGAAALAAPLLGSLAALSASGAAHAQRSAKTLRIGYQKYGNFVVLKARGSLEKRLADQHVSVQWIEFPGGPQLLEGLNAGAIDVGTVGETPPVFALAGGVDFVYVGSEPPAPQGEAIVVPHDSPIRAVADLRGRKIALNKGSNVHYLLVNALQRAKVDYRDVTPVYLAPADARAAFAQRGVDAWVIWDPYLAAIERQANARDRKRQRAREQHAVLSREPEVRRSRAATRARAARRSRCGRSLGAREHRHGRRATIAARRPRHGHARACVETRELRRSTDRRCDARVSAADRRYVRRPQADSAQDRRCRRALASGIGARASQSRGQSAEPRPAVAGEPLTINRLLSGGRSRHYRNDGFPGARDTRAVRQFALPSPSSGARSSLPASITPPTTDAPQDSGLLQNTLC